MIKKSIFGCAMIALLASSFAFPSQGKTFICTVNKSASSWIKKGQVVTIPLNELKISHNGKRYHAANGMVSRIFAPGFDEITIDIATSKFADVYSEQSSPINGKVLAVGTCKER